MLALTDRSRRCMARERERGAWTHRTKGDPEATQSGDSHLPALVDIRIAVVCAARQAWAAQRKLWSNRAGVGVSAGTGQKCRHGELTGEAAIGQAVPNLVH